MVIGGYFASIEKAGFATFISLTRKSDRAGRMYDVADRGAWRGRNWWSPLMAEAVCFCIFALNAEEKLCKTEKELA